MQKVKWGNNNDVLAKYGNTIVNDFNEWKPKRNLVACFVHLDHLMTGNP